MFGSHSSLMMFQALLPYVAPRVRPPLLQLVFMSEINALISSYQECLRTCDSRMPQKNPSDMEDMFRELSPFLSQEDKEHFSQMKDMMEMIQMMQDLKE